ncbi:ABC transporter permease [Vandammella animalimorsus]|uniref:ABC transporter n=1 Tax=Vandammella animalimorsus TaxID=2029117 RepID=A0A2A2ACH8_9BURK|nr:ABC transporter permease [Vandammella animalimorsus]PAT35448.1 ABC transporter [Vandammella animalimorsus]
MVRPTPPARPVDAAPRQGFVAHWLAALRAMLRDQGVLLLVVGGPLFYSFFYPWFYSAQVVQRVPVAIVVPEADSLTRQLLRYADASPQLAVNLVTADAQQARQALLRGDIYGYAELPRGLKRGVLRREPVHVTVYAHGSYPLVSKQVQQGFAQSFGTVAAGVQLKRLQAGGQSAPQAAASRAPLQLQSTALFNPTGGYGSFVVAAVALLILQQTLLMGIAMLVATWREQQRAAASPNAWLARLLAFCLPGWLAGLYYFGWMFFWHDYPSGGNPLGALALLGLFVPAVVGCAALLGLWVADRERVLYLVLFTSLPLAFLAGFTWPAEALPPWLEWLRWASPSTAAIQASLRLNQLGAPLAAALGPLAVLAAIALLGWLGTLLAGSRQRSPAPP